MKAEQINESFLNQAAPLVSFLALLGIPAAGMGALVFSLQIPRILYGKANPLFLAAEIGSLIGLFALVLLLRSCLTLPSAPHGSYRDALDFLAVKDWHPAVTAAAVGLVVLPGAWYFHYDRDLIMLLMLMGRRVLRSGDFRDDLDRLTVSYQLALTGGVPLLFCLHMLTRWKPKRRMLPWVLVPVLFVGAAIGAVFIVTMLH